MVRMFDEYDAINHIILNEQSGQSRHRTERNHNLVLTGRRDALCGPTPTRCVCREASLQERKGTTPITPSVLQHAAPSVSRVSHGNDVLVRQMCTLWVFGRVRSLFGSPLDGTHTHSHTYIHTQDGTSPSLFICSTVPEFRTHGPMLHGTDRTAHKHLTL